MKKQATTSKATPFSCKAPDANSVYLAGTFNNWDPVLTPLKKKKDGTWSTTVKLSPGHYEYKFVVDGNWCCSPGCNDHHSCPNCVINEHGTMNRVIEVV
jgi:1,4-alpha-glucan branching enzyme